MRVLLDECLPKRLKRELVGHDVKTAPEMGWATKRNSELLALAVSHFDVFLTADHGGLAGDQVYVDFDLGYENIPPGTRLQVGSAVIEVSAAPHTGCAKFSARFGKDALRFVNSEVGRQLNLRGINAKVVEAGTVRTGVAVRKLM